MRSATLTIRIFQLLILPHLFFPRYYEYFTVKRRKTKRIGHVWRKNSLRKHVVGIKIEGRVEVTGRQGRRRKQLLFDLKEMIEYWKLNEEVLDGTLWRTRLGERITSIPQCVCGAFGREVLCCSRVTT